MGSRKPSAKAKRREEFHSQLGGMDDMFAREQRRVEQDAVDRDAAKRNKACRSKNRYDTYAQAQDAIAACAEHGTAGLQAYRCSYCGGWHLTSHPWE